MYGGGYSGLGGMGSSYSSYGGMGSLGGGYSTLGRNYSKFEIIQEPPRIIKIQTIRKIREKIHKETQVIII